MKHSIFTLILILVFNISHSQNARRFYNKLDLIFLNQDDDKTIPYELNKIYKWGKETANNIYYANHQRNINPKNSASFNSLDLILKRNFDFNFLDSDFIISFNNNIEKRETKVNVLNNNVWRIKSYNAIIDLDTFNPENMVNNFYYMKILGGISDHQMLAHFININYSYNDSISSTKRFIRNLNKSQNLNLNEHISEDKSFTIAKLCKEIDAKNPNSNCTFPAFLTFIKDENREKTIFNINKFYRGILNRSLTDVMNNELLPEGDFNFTKKNVTVTLPSKIFKNKKAKSTPISFNLRELKYNIRYDFNKKAYYMSVSLTPYKNTISEDISFKSTRFNPVKGKKEQTNILVKKETIKTLEFDVFANEISNITIKGSDTLYAYGDYFYSISKTIKLK